MKRIQFSTFVVFAVLATTGPWSPIQVSCGRADMVQLTNGDVLHGTVDWLNENSLQLTSEIHGALRIKRDKIAAIGLGDHPVLTAAAPALPGGPGPAANPFTPGARPQAATQSVEEIVKQLQVGGIDAKDLQDVQKAFPLIAAPEAQKEFTRMLGGLMSGTFGVGDLRREAIQARDQIKDLSNELGPEATSALQGYLGILNRFIDESAPAKAPPPAAPVQSAPGQPVPVPPQPAPPASPQR